MTTLTTELLFRTLRPSCFFKGQTTNFHGITDHSSQAGPGIVFFALPSKQRGPEGFIDLALHKGVTAIVAPEAVVMKKQTIFSHITFFGVKDIRLALAETAHLLFPKTPDFMAGITGTNGKTSIANFTHQLWQSLGKKSISLGTLGLKGMDYLPLSPTHTTPEPLDLYPLLDEAAGHGITHCALEASSHGIHQRRLDGIKFNVGVFSNFSQDHLDYHLNLRTYWLAKVRLFKELIAHQGTAISHINLPHPYDLAEACRKNSLTHWTYGIDDGDVKVNKITCLPEGQKVEATFLGQPLTFSFPLIGRFQLENLIASLLIVHASGVPLEELIPHTQNITPVEGRLEYVGTTPSGGSIYIDYAHTPGALETALKDLRAHTKKSLFVVFGCGGDRDQSKRSQMGNIAHTLADHVIITDDNPRQENPDHIRNDILKGAPDAHSIPGRDEAISVAIDKLKEGDVLVIAGKGHERFQVVGTRSLPFNDKHAALRKLKQLKAS